MAQGPGVSQSPPMYTSSSPARLVVQENTGDRSKPPVSANKIKQPPQLGASTSETVGPSDVLNGGKPNFMNGGEPSDGLVPSQSREIPPLDTSGVSKLQGGLSKSPKVLGRDDNGLHSSPKRESTQLPLNAPRNAVLKTTESKAHAPRYLPDGGPIRVPLSVDVDGRIGKSLPSNTQTSEFRSSSNQEVLRGQENVAPSDSMSQHVDETRSHRQAKDGWSLANGSGSEFKKQEANNVETSDPVLVDQSTCEASSIIPPAIPSAVPVVVDSSSNQTAREKSNVVDGKDNQETITPPANSAHRSQEIQREGGSNERNDRMADGSNPVAFSTKKAAGRPYGYHNTLVSQTNLVGTELRWNARNTDATAHSSWKPESGVGGSSGIHGKSEQKSASGWKPQSDLNSKINMAHTNPDMSHPSSNRASSGNNWTSTIPAAVPKPLLPPRVAQSRPQERPLATPASHALSQSSYSQNSNVASNPLPGLLKTTNDREKVATYVQTNTAQTNSMSKAHRGSPAKGVTQAEKPLPKTLGPSSNRSLGGENLPIIHESTSVRSADGVAVPSPHPFSSGSQPPGHGRADTGENGTGSQRRPLKVEDALAYLEKVKSQFSDQVSVYNKFLDIMKDFKAQSIDTTEVIKRVSELFRGHEDLILGFNTFLPPGYKIEVRENRDTGALNAGFVGPHGQYSEFPVIKRPNSSKSAPQRSRSGKKQPVAPLIRSKDSKANAASAGQSSVVPIAEPTSQSRDRRIGMSPSSLNMMTTPTPAPKASVSAQKPIPVSEHEGTNHQAPVSQRHSVQQQPLKKPESYHDKSSELDQVLGFVSNIKSRFSDKPENFGTFLDAFRCFRCEETSINDVYTSIAKLLGPHKDLLAQFEKFIPCFAKPVVADVSKPNLPKSRRQPGESTTVFPKAACGDVNTFNYDNVKKNCPPRNLKFFEKFKIQLGPKKAHLYNEFVKCLSLASQGIVTQEELLTLTAEILHNSPDAQKAFVTYLEATGDCEEGDSGGDGSSLKPGGDPPIDPERLEYFKSKPMSEVASESGYDAIFSYRRMPKDFPKCTHTGRSSMERRVLNDTWVNVTTGSEDYAFVRKNTSEDNLFRAEDDRYELDMVISANQATILKLEAVISTILRLPPNEKKGHALAPGVLSPIHFNAIRRIYGSHGDEMVSQVKMNPSNAVGVVLKRLKQKDEEWRKVRSTMHKLWREVGERNYHKSLDHRSTFFKMVDKKDLSLKNLVTDILDPIGSMTSRDSEMTRVRTYAIPKGAGGSADWSGAVTAVAAAAQVPVDLAPRSLELKFEHLAMHTEVMRLIQKVAADDGSPDVKRCINEFEKVVVDFFDTNPSDGLNNDQHWLGAGEGKNLNDQDKQLCDTRLKSCSEKADKRHDYNVLYGDEAIYNMLRLYHLLYERILNAWILSNDQIYEKKRRDKLSLGASLKNAELMRAESIVKPRITKVGIGHDLGANGFTLCPKGETAKEIFSEFLAIALPFVRGKMECAKFEERCRVLLGTKCYSLFTLDKVMHRLVKQIGAVFCADGSSRELVSLYKKSRDIQKRPSEQKASLSAKGTQEIYCIAASRYMAETRSPGSHLMRFSCERCDLRGQEVDVGELKVGVMRGETEQRRCEAVDKIGCLMTIEVIGRTGDEEHGQHDREQQNMVDALLEFCGSFGDKHNRGSGKTGSDLKRKDGDSISGGRGDWRKDGKRLHEDDGRAERNRAKKRKTSSSELLRFRGNQRDMIRRAKAMVSKNDLIFCLDVNGVMNFVGGTGDYTFVRGRKRKWSGPVEPQGWNNRSLTTRQARKKLKLDHKVGSLREGRHGMKP